MSNLPVTNMSPQYALDLVQYSDARVQEARAHLARKTLERDELIADAVSLGASLDDIAAGLGLSVGQVRGSLRVVEQACAGCGWTAPDSGEGWPVSRLSAHISATGHRL